MPMMAEDFVNVMSFKNGLIIGHERQMQLQVSSDILGGYPLVLDWKSYHIISKYMVVLQQRLTAEPHLNQELTEFVKSGMLGNWEQLFELLGKQWVFIFVTCLMPMPLPFGDSMKFE